MYYMLNMKGYKPTYYKEYDEALKKYVYLKEYCSRTSLIRVNWKRVYKDVIVTKRTI